MSKCRWIACGLAAMLCLSAAAEESLSRERVAQIEYTLYGMGYHADTFDETLDDTTRAALRNFQIANGLEATGLADAQTLALLESGTGVTCHDYLASVSHNYADVPMLQIGSMGDSVKKIQNELKALGYFANNCDGVYGEETQTAVRRFQMANGLCQTGIADRSTQMRLGIGSPLSWQTFLDLSTSKYGDMGPHVRQMQFELKNMGYFGGDCTGSFGDLTREALMQFQFANNLTQTGDADLMTCTTLYSGTAAARVDPHTLCGGDYSDRVSWLQGELASHGYYNYNITGVYGATTETAVRLFQIAHRLPATGSADRAMQELLASESALPLGAVRVQLAEQVRNQDDSARAAIGKVAQDLRGRAFKSDDEDLYAGFAFVQYVCASAGIPLVAPEDVIDLISEPVKNYEDILPGDILAFKDADGSTIMAIGSDGGRAIYATSNAGWVLESDLRELKKGKLYRWNMKASMQ